MPDLESFLDGADVDRSVFELRPDYRAVLLAVDGITPGASDEHSGQHSEALLVAAEAWVRGLDGRPVEEFPHNASWREAYRAFGAKPQRTRNSLEALTRRAASEAGLPRVNRLTDIYNAVSVLHQVPLAAKTLTGTSDRRGCSAPPARSRSTPSPTEPTSSSTPSPARLSGATRPA